MAAARDGTPPLLLPCRGEAEHRAPEGEAAPTTYTYDPNHPVPTIGGSFSGQRTLVAAGAFDQREREFTGDQQTGFYGSAAPFLPLRARPDVVVFETDRWPRTWK